MSVSKISYANKVYGDLWTSQEANEIKNVVNGNADELSSLKSTSETMQETLDEVAGKNAENTQAISNLVQANVTQVFLTQEQYDALVDAGTVKSDVLYNIYE